jgi:MazG family protein
MKTHPEARAWHRAGKLFERLVALQARLLAPGGCPWDREQTHESLRTYLVEETYEVLDALESGSAEKFADELGDLLLRIIFHSRLAEQAGRFDIGDVIEHIHNKMVRRHPHVFGTVYAPTAKHILKNWEQIKKQERQLEQESKGKPAPGREFEESEGTLHGVSRSLPALMEAYQLTRKAARVGFDWKAPNDVMKKLREEIRELEVELEVATGGENRIEEEVGDLLFTVVNIARVLGFDPEVTLKKANRKFISRFQAMERSSAASGGKLEAMAPAELDALWNEAKAAESEVFSAGLALDVTDRRPSRRAKGAQ